MFHPLLILGLLEDVASEIVLILDQMGPDLNKECFTKFDLGIL